PADRRQAGHARLCRDDTDAHALGPGNVAGDEASVQRRGHEHVRSLGDALLQARYDPFGAALGITDMGADAEELELLAHHGPPFMQGGDLLGEVDEEDALALGAGSLDTHRGTTPGGRLQRVGYDLLRGLAGEGPLRGLGTLYCCAERDHRADQENNGEDTPGQGCPNLAVAKHDAHPPISSRPYNGTTDRRRPDPSL